MLTIKLEIDLRPLEKYVNILSTPGQKGFDEVLLRWIVRYKKFALARFRSNAGGGGDWPPLKPPIRKRVRKRSKLILRDSDTIMNALEPKRTLAPNPSPGASTRRTLRGVNVGFGGNHRHPYARMSIGRLAMIHHQGNPRLPSRKVLPIPDERMIRLMTEDVRKVANEIKRNLGMH